MTAPSPPSSASLSVAAVFSMRLTAAGHQIHAVEGLHHEIGNEQVRLGFGSFEGFKRIKRRSEEARVEAFHGEQGADDFADHRFVIDDENRGLACGCDALSALCFS